MKKFTALFAALLTITVFLMTAFAFGGDVSPAIEYIRKSRCLEKCGVLGERICFSAKDYNALVGSDVKYITVTSLPDSDCGELKLNGIPVINGQTIASASLDYLTFTPKNNQADAAFTFRCSAKSWTDTDIKCKMTFLKEKNMPPVINDGSFQTYKNTSGEYLIDFFEPDGDDVFFKIDSYPVSGSLRIKDGVLQYTPKKDFIGNDTVTVHAVDKYGNASRTVTLEINVSADNTMVFADMLDSSVHTQAISLAKKDIVTYVYKDGEYLFNPDKEVTRLEFVIMLMTAKQIETDTGTDLPFTDTASLTNAQKGYLSKALSLGMARSKEFKPDGIITRKEAACMISDICGIAKGEKPLKDISKCNEKEKAAICSSVAAGIFSTENGVFRPDKAMTREDTVRILSRLN